MSYKTTYTKIAAKIIFVTMVITLVFAFVYGEYMKRNAITNLAHIDAKKTSLLVFEALYSAMQRGWNKDDLNEIIGRLNNVDKNMKINVYRSEIVAQRFGEIEKDKKARTTDKDIMTAIHGKEVLSISESDLIKYYYPVKAKSDCLKCHTNATVGDTLGVIDVSYPIEDLKISLSEMINFFILFIVIFSLTVYAAIFVELRQYLIKPIKNFVNVIKSITASNDMKKRVNIDDNIEEIDSIKNVFNSMLDSIEHQFYYDSLTGLENRRRLTERLEEKANVFLMIINIDAFQEINDLYGDPAGDIILKEFALYLQEIMPKHNGLYRLHSDEFAHVCNMGMSLHEYKIFASLISEKISRKSFTISETSEVSLSATMGISHGSESLLMNADIALKLAKKSKKNFLIYDDSMAMAKEYEKNFEWTKRLKRAIEEDKIVPVFQPIVDTVTQKIVKYEALMRMVDHNGSYIAPIHFLDLAKKNKLYHQLTNIIVEKTLKIFKDLPYIVSINISVEDIINKDTNNFILKKLQESNMGSQIVFEIIESEGIENFEQVLEFIDSVKQYGAKISIDDFGTGYSNFEYLMKLKVDYIKIDGSMIKNIDSDENAKMITKTIVDFAKSMNIQTVAEFVHSKNVYEKVKDLEVDFSQGYYFGEPVATV
ncbi:EAL domain-containing protein [Sulfuricurvum sp.]|uniref:EAL domain-containing protein n=1 Tax=Sulfuricurvum sp. TaxID=2025608 RepID=UPI0026155795|nr:GGDEF and EAL domain-containing protein [Sulfuricurvum sp.]MDD2265422.1 EAL domain-containing protein [Sulfuricurvum sp.]MDD2784633.1 EAL domain-containing protein [Sulfuricurvum sp.]